MLHVWLIKQSADVLTRHFFDNLAVASQIDLRRDMNYRRVSCRLLMWPSLQLSSFARQVWRIRRVPGCNRTMLGTIEVHGAWGPARSGSLPTPSSTQCLNKRVCDGSEASTNGKRFNQSRAIGIFLYLTALWKTRESMESTWPASLPILPLGPPRMAVRENFRSRISSFGETT